MIPPASPGVGEGADHDQVVSRPRETTWNRRRLSRIRRRAAAGRDARLVGRVVNAEYVSARLCAATRPGGAPPAPRRSTGMRRHDEGAPSTKPATRTDASKSTLTAGGSRPCRAASDGPGRTAPTRSPTASPECHEDPADSLSRTPSSRRRRSPRPSATISTSVPALRPAPSRSALGMRMRPKRSMVAGLAGHGRSVARAPELAMMKLLPVPAASERPYRRRRTPPGKRSGCCKARARAPPPGDLYVRVDELLTRVRMRVGHAAACGSAATSG